MHWSLILLVACAPVRKPFGEIAVRAVHEMHPEVVLIHDAVFRIQSGRLTTAGSEAGTRLDIVATDDGCLRGDSQISMVQICGAPSLPGDPKGLYRWNSVGGHLLSFSTQLLDFGDKLRLEAGTAAAELNLPPGPAGDELRRHPEFLGTAFALGLFPASADPREQWLYEVRAR